MKKKLVAHLSLLIVFTMVAIGCQNGHSKNPGTSTSRDETENNVTTEFVETEPQLDFAPTSFDGTEFVIYTQDWYTFSNLDVVDVFVEEMDNTQYIDAAYNRIIKIEDKYDCTIVEADARNCGPSAAYDELYNTIFAGDANYDVLLFRSTYLMRALGDDLLVDLNDVSYLNAEKPWWDSNSWEQLSVLGKNFVVCGDMTMQDEVSVFNIYFNKKMIDDNQLESPYDLVKNGTWTYEKLYEMGEVVAKDVNLDDKMGVEDIFGATHIFDAFTCMVNGIDVTFGEINDEGALELTFTDEASVVKIMDLFSWLARKDVSCFPKETGFNEMDVFMNNQTLFCFGGIYYGTTFRAMNGDYGILPFPKYDETQKDYHSSTSSLFLCLTGVPTTNTDLEKTGMFMEIFAEDGYKSVRPGFYDSLLQRKVARDDESREMLDFIFGNITYDVGAIFNPNNIVYDVGVQAIQYNSNISSFIASKKDAADQAIEGIMATIRGESKT